MLVADTLKSLKSATKSVISAHTGLSLATCGTILNGLYARGEIIEESIDESSGGWPAKRYIYNPDYFRVLSIYADGTNHSGIISSALTSADGKIIEENENSYNNLTTEVLIEYIRNIKFKYSNIKAIGIGLPGIVVDGKVLTCDITSLEGLAIAEILNSHFNVFVQVGNDINYAALGFYRNNYRDVTDPIAYIFMPPRHCAGCGIVISGKMLRGASQFAGEVSNLPFYDELPQSSTIHMSDFGKLIHIVSCLITIINPVTVAISGEYINKAFVEKSPIELLKKFDSKHLPYFVYRDNIKPDYHSGISQYTLDAFNNFRTFES